MLRRKKISSKETRFYPEIVFAHPYNPTQDTNRFVHLRKTQGLSLADHDEIIRKKPRIDVGDADDRDADARMKNLI
jgi:hypothetical protein